MRSLKLFSQTAILLAGAISNVTLFAQQPAGTGLTTIYTFAGSPDGAAPSGNLLVDRAGALYGSTTQGGALGAGSVFEVAPSGTSWKETVLYSFTGGNDGGIPYGSLTMDTNGNLYGATQVGGAAGCGVVFELTSNAGVWSEQVLYSFSCGADGYSPNGNLVFDTKGNLYGTTTYGGPINANCAGFGSDIQPGCGVVFKLAPPATSGGAWTQSVLYSFGGALDGATPFSGLVIDSTGAVYGTTAYGGPVNALCPTITIGAPAGCGVVFELAPPATSGGAWTQSVLYSFTAGTDGARPEAGVVFNKSGNLFGTTAYAGGTSASGTVFELSPPATSGAAWTFAVLRNLGGSHGTHPYGDLAIDKTGNVYGSTYAGGTHGHGAVFQLVPPATAGAAWKDNVLYSFKGKTDGANPLGGLVTHGRFLYGTTSTSGGASGSGTVFKVRQ